MTVRIKKSWAEKQTSGAKVWRLIKKYSHKAAAIRSVIRASYDFGIPLSEVTKNALCEKLALYDNERRKLNSLWNSKFNPNYKGHFDFDTFNKRYRETQNASYYYTYYFNK